MDRDIRQFLITVSDFKNDFLAKCMWNDDTLLLRRVDFNKTADQTISEYDCCALCPLSVHFEFGIAATV